MLFASGPPGALPLSRPGVRGARAGVRGQPLRGLHEFVRELAPGGASAGGPVSRLAPVVTIAVTAALAALLVLRGHAFVAALEHAVHARWTLVAAGALFEAASVAGYVLLLHRVVAAASPRLRGRDSFDITLAGTAATRLLPTAGLGGAAVTVWALRSHGVRSRELAERMIAFLILLYSVYIGALVACGGAVAVGLAPVHGGRAIGIVAIAVGVGIPAALGAVACAPALLARAAHSLGGSSGRLVTLAERGSTQAPVLRGALRRARFELRQAHPALLGAVAWWGFDIAVLSAMLHAFGASPALPVLVLAYFMGTLFNVLPLPGSLSAGLVGMLVALGTPAAPAIAAVLAYRAVAVWLPAAAGVPAVGRLRTTVARWRADAGIVPEIDTRPSPAVLAG